MENNSILELKNKKIIICVPTYRRPNYLEKNLTSLSRQNFDYKYEIVVVDNDSKQSAKPIVSKFKNENNKFSYFVQNKRGIAAVRNKCIDICKEKNADYLIFIDEDEIAEKTWLKNLFKSAEKYNAKVVEGPVLCKFEDYSIKDVIKRIYFHRRRFKTGSIINNCATGNVFINMNIFKNHPALLFNENFGLMGGEDTRFFEEVKTLGIKMIWCDEAITHEFISIERSKLKNCLLRSFYKGNASFYIFKLKNGFIHALCKSITNLIILFFDIFRFFIFVILFNKLKYYKIGKKIMGLLGFVIATFNFKNKKYKSIFGN